MENQEEAKCKTGLEKKIYYAKCRTQWKELSGPNSQCGSGIINIINGKRLSVGLDPRSRPRFDRFARFELFFFFLRPAPAGALFMRHEQCTKAYE